MNITKTLFYIQNVWNQFEILKPFSNKNERAYSECAHLIECLEDNEYWMTVNFHFTVKRQYEVRINASVEANNIIN